MPSSRRHRGPHPEDHELFALEKVAPLREAARDLAWLWSRGYAQPSSEKLVGDRYQLVKRQRAAIARSCCSDSRLTDRLKRRQPVEAIEGESLWIDGFNVITTLEVAFSQGVLLRGREGAVRDMAGVHGSYRLVEETLPALGLCLHALMSWKPRSVTFLLDQPVSNSGRLAGEIRRLIQGLGLEEKAWQVQVVRDPDPLLAAREDGLMATADAAVLDAGSAWVNLISHILSWGEKEDVFPHSLWYVDLEEEG